MSLLVVMGSGETAPTMVKVHRQIFAATAGDGPAVLLDTPFGFQLNADDLVEKTLGYFAASVGARVEAARWRRADAPVAEAEGTLALLSRASWAFAGPGSPSYALRHWTSTAVPGGLVDVVARGGTLVVGSAAACTIGTHAIPVYEIYKVGEDPRWLPGLDVLGRLTGVRAAVVPHFDNTEGGASHDTRYCYLGEPRLARLEAELPDEIGILGVDEHTALIIDVSARTAQVAGNGRVSIRRRGSLRVVLPAGEELPLATLDALLRGVSAAADVSVTPVEAAVPGGEAAGRELPSLGLQTRAAHQRFEAALAGRDVSGCVTAILDLETAIVAWSADTDQNDDADRAHRALRTMIVRLGELAEQGARDPRDVVSPYVELALALRGRARAARDYAASDLIRDELATVGVEVRDTPDGVRWEIMR
ncbi:MAG TPA: hypothetical protein VI248_08530 [Kineosporiaceae bacterium]